MSMKFLHIDQYFINGTILGFWETAHLPLPNLTFCLKWEENVHVGLGEG